MGHGMLAMAGVCIPPTHRVRLTGHSVSSHYKKGTLSILLAPMMAFSTYYRSVSLVISATRIGSGISLGIIRLDVIRALLLWRFRQILVRFIWKDYRDDAANPY